MGNHVTHIYVDEAGTHDDAPWLVIGMLFVRKHGRLHSALLKAQEDIQHYNTKPNRSVKYAEFSLKDCRGPGKRVEVGKRFAEVFLTNDCYFRSIVFDWSIWNSSKFGDPFETQAQKKRRAYKKWCELLIHHERYNLCNTDLYLDELKIVSGYDVLDHLKMRFTENYEGGKPWIRRFVHAKSWHDEQQCLQLCDLLTGGIYRRLVGETSSGGKIVVEHLAAALSNYPGPKPIRLGQASYWKMFHKRTLTDHFPKFSQWHWLPSD